MSQHTPGPWTVESDQTTVSMGGQCVIVAPAPDTASREECIANARLIAAAPELYRALRELIAEADDHPGWEGHKSQTLGFEWARDAVKRAEGKTA